jgi:phage major head subunit gpT-like protein
MVNVSGAFSYLLAPGLRKVFFQHLEDRPAEYSKIANQEKSSKAYEEDLEVGGLGSMPIKPEGRGIVYQDFRQGGKKRYIHLTYGLGFRVTLEMMEDDLYNVMKKNTKELSKAARNAREVAFFNMLNNGFTTEYGFPKFGLNEPLFSATHTKLGGGTGSNRAATDADLSPTSLEAAIISFESLTDEMDIPVVIKPKLLVVGPQLKMTAREILGSEFRPYTSNNEINALREEGLDYMVGHYIVDPDSWFLLAGKGDHDLNFFERQAVRFQNGDDFDSGDAKFKAFQRFSTGAGEWRGAYGSQGA